MQQTFQSRCQAGFLFIDQTTISLVTFLHREPIWRMPRNSMITFTVKWRFISGDLEIVSAQGTYTLRYLPKKKVQEFMVLFSTPEIVPIESETQRLQFEIEQRRLELRQVNTTMANARAHYEQTRWRGGGDINRIVRASQKGRELGTLKRQQPMKEQLQQEKLALEQRLQQLNVLKSQGSTTIARYE
jgi:hypothetical protein